MFSSTFASNLETLFLEYQHDILYVFIVWVFPLLCTDFSQIWFCTVLFCQYYSPSKCMMYILISISYTCFLCLSPPWSLCCDNMENYYPEVGLSCAPWEQISSHQWVLPAGTPGTSGRKKEKHVIIRDSVRSFLGKIQKLHQLSLGITNNVMVLS